MEEGLANEGGDDGWSPLFSAGVLKAMMETHVPSNQTPVDMFYVWFQSNLQHMFGFCTGIDRESTAQQRVFRFLLSGMRVAATIHFNTHD